MRTDTGRRKLLGLLVLGLGSALGALAGVRPHPEAQRVRAVVARLFSDPRSAALVGRAYLSSFPEDADPNRLIASTLGVAHPAEGTIDPADAARRVRERHRQDFEQGRVVLVDGWMLSLTEARVCALAAVLA